MNPPEALPPFCRSRPLLAILVISVLGLFVELMLIRWIGTEVRIFAYLQNTVLVVCFLGLGLGAFTCRQSVDFRRLLTPLLVLLLLLAIPFTRRALGSISEMLGSLEGVMIWHQAISEQPIKTFGYVFLGLATTFLLLLLIAEIFVPIGRCLGRLLDDHPNTIRAYSVNVIGSLLGIWGFVALSVLYLPPGVWMALAAMLLVPFLWRGSHARLNTGLLFGCVGLAWIAGLDQKAISVHWSPYQKLVLREIEDREGKVGELSVEVNNTGFQAIVDLREETVLADPERYPPKMRGCSQYDLPSLLHPHPQSLLAVGAGTGNDVAGALRQGVKEVVAVEIDPAIIDIGTRHHPEKPYDSPRVTVVNDDARSYFAGCRRKFDVISFGLLDSHTMTSMTNAQLDHYVYTRESMEQAKSLLTEHGVVVLSFAAVKPFIEDRIAGTLRSVFGEEPICFGLPSTHYGWGGTMFIAGDLETAREQIATNRPLAAMVAEWQQKFPVALSYTTPITTDDWPYLYLESRHIPILFFFLVGLMALLMWRFQRKLQMPNLLKSWSLSHWHFFFLGAAFLLLEVQNISKASVVLGNTWWVSAVIISGVLIMVLLANAITERFPNIPRGPVYLALCGSCVILYFVDISRFASMPFASKAIIVGGLTTLPMFFSGLVFIRSFSLTPSKHEALGANLMGALAGALLQSITYWSGIKALLLIVTVLYLLAAITATLSTQDRRVGPNPVPV
ncbi:MAG: hypothetical protein ACE5EQ_00070 [Phycisphaerae bacterium]